MADYDECPFCGARLQGGEDVCPVCGEDLDVENE